MNKKKMCRDYNLNDKSYGSNEQRVLKRDFAIFITRKDFKRCLKIYIETTAYDVCIVVT